AAWIAARPGPGAGRAPNPRTVAGPHPGVRPARSDVVLGLPDAAVAGAAHDQPGYEHPHVDRRADAVVHLHPVAGGRGPGRLAGWVFSFGAAGARSRGGA